VLGEDDRKFPRNSLTLDVKKPVFKRIQIVVASIVKFSPNKVRFGTIKSFLYIFYFSQRVKIVNVSKVFIL